VHFWRFRAKNPGRMGEQRICYSKFATSRAFRSNSSDLLMQILRAFRFNPLHAHGFRDSEQALTQGFGNQKRIYHEPHQHHGKTGISGKKFVFSVWLAVKFPGLRNMSYYVQNAAFLYIFDG
jgi:hypothetical protein